jgi:hypothetical protein
MAVLVHNRQTDLLVVCLLPAVDWKVLRMMDCGSRQVNNPCPVGFRVPTRRGEAETILQIQLLPLKLKLVEAGQPPTLLQLTGTGDSGLLEC